MSNRPLTDFDKSMNDIVRKERARLRAERQAQFRRQMIAHTFTGAVLVALVGVLWILEKLV